MTDPGQNGNYNPFPQSQQYGQQQAPYGQQPQNVYNPYPQQYGQQPYGPAAEPAAKAAVEEEKGSRTPVASIIFIFLAISIFFVRYSVNFANGGLTATNILYFLADIAACVLMLLGLFISKKRMLYGFGLFVFAAVYFVDIIRSLAGGGQASEISMNFFLISAYTLAGLYYVLKGKGIKKGLKLVACIIGLVFEMSSAIVLFTNVMSYIPAQSMGLFAVQVFMSMAAMIFIWIATLIFTPFGRKKN